MGGSCQHCAAVKDCIGIVWGCVDILNDCLSRRPGDGGWFLSGEWSRFCVVGDGLRARGRHGGLSW